MSLVGLQQEEMHIPDTIFSTLIEAGYAEVVSQDIDIPSKEEVYHCLATSGYKGTKPNVYRYIVDTLMCGEDDVAFLHIKYPLGEGIGKNVIDLHQTPFIVVSDDRDCDLVLAVDSRKLVLVSTECNKTTYRDDLKHDDDKCRLDLVEPSLIEAVGWIRTFGIKKYPEVYGYKKLDPQRIMGALLRHINAYRMGESNDTESGYSHLWHAACNLMFLIELEREGKSNE